MCCAVASYIASFCILTIVLKLLCEWVALECKAKRSWRRCSAASSCRWCSGASSCICCSGASSCRRCSAASSCRCCSVASSCRRYCVAPFCRRCAVLQTSWGRCSAKFSCRRCSAESSPDPASSRRLQIRVSKQNSVIDSWRLQMALSRLTDFVRS